MRHLLSTQKNIEAEKGANFRGRAIILHSAGQKQKRAPAWGELVK